MLNLAAFMQTLLNWVPNSDSPAKDLQSSGAFDSTRSLCSENDEDEDDDKSAGGKVTLDHIHLSIGENTFMNEDINNFLLPRGPVTPEMAKNIVTLYRRKGKLSHKSLQRILREVYTPLKQSSNISYISIGREEKITVIGDLHGQLGDLFHILDESGFPSLTNKYLFNGDFVDRGIQGIEVIVVILSLYSAFPNCVYLNRGNHEDESICRVYGFEKECREKYDDLIFGMFAEVFRHLPLASIINNSIFVVHGGLFHSDNITLSDIEQIDRTDYIAKPPVPYPQCIEEMTTEEAHQEFLKQLQRDLLWSDPSPEENGITRNQRGAGVKFGSDVVEKFLSDNNLKMIIRSHECVRKGFDLPFANTSSSAKNLLATIFSASNYSGGHNDGAYLIFTTHRMTKSYPVENCPLNQQMFYSVHKYKTSDAKKSLIEVNKMSLRELIIRKRKSLMQAFELADQESSGEVTKMACVEIMQEITGLKIFWLSTIHNLVPSCVSGNSINYYDFINNFSLKSSEGSASSPSPYLSSGPSALTADSNTASDSGLASNEEKLLTIDSLYGQRSKLEAVFRFFDTNGDGMISREEFHRGCDIINMTLPSDQQLKDYDHVLNLMDFDHSDSIDLNEFFEVCSLSLALSSPALLSTSSPVPYSSLLPPLVAGVPHLGCQGWSG
jgi:serine/threonine-protein phosphatase with EF-hands